jgi:hypothetical protein
MRRRKPRPERGPVAANRLRSRVRNEQSTRLSRVITDPARASSRALP